MKRLIATAVAVLAMTLGMVAPPAQAAAPGEFGAPSTLQGAGVVASSPGAATLPTGAVAVAYPMGTTVTVRIRKPGAAAFGPALTRALPAGYSFAISGLLMSGPVVNVLPLGTSSFALAWTECNGPCRVVTVNLPVTAVSIPAPTLVSAADDAVSMEPRLSTTTDGSAAVMWLVSAVGGYSLRVSQRAGASGGWSAPTTAATTNLPFNFRVAIDSNRSVTAGWVILTGTDMDVRLRARVNGTWGLPVVASTFHAGAFAATSDVFDMAAAGSSTVVAALNDIAGMSNYSDPTPVGVRVLSRTGTSSSFDVDVAGVTGPGRYAVQPTVSVTANGGAVVRFGDLMRMVSAPPDHSQVTSMLVQRRTTTGAWTLPSAIDAVGTANPDAWYRGVRYRPTLLADGTYLTPSLRPVRVGTSVAAGLGLQGRTGWGAAMSDDAAFGLAIIPSPAIALTNATGRTTMVYFSSTIELVASTSILTKPAPVARASLSTTAPRRGTAVTCRVTWAEATSVSYRWLRNGVVISGATARTYTPRAADVGEQLTCRSAGSNAKGAVASVAIARTVRS